MNYILSLIENYMSDYTGPLIPSCYNTFVFNTCVTTRWQCNENYKQGKNKGTSFT